MSLADLTNSETDFTGSFFTLLRPYPLMIGLLGFTAILMHGASYAASKLEGVMRDRARTFVKKIIFVYVVLFALSTIYTVIDFPEFREKPIFWVAVGFVTISLALQVMNTVVVKNDRLAFILSTVSFTGLWAVAGAVHFPKLVNASNDQTLSLTLYNASSSETTLKLMLGIAVIGMPIVILYTAYIYRVLRKKSE